MCLAASTKSATTGVHVWTSLAPAGQERAASHALLRQAAADLTDLAQDDIELVTGSEGRPEVLGAGHLHVSISHTCRAVAVAVSRDAEVGVDIEPVRPVPAVALARRFLAPEDVGWLSRLPARHRSSGFLWLWTHKEAQGKARGRGLRGGALIAPVPRPWPWPVLTDVATSDRQRQVWLRQVPGNDGTVTAALAAPDGYLLATAVRSAEPRLPLTVYDVTPVTAT